MVFTVFYAWQSDIDQNVNRYFIRDAIKIAINNLRRDDVVEDAPRLDHDTKGVPGIPDIFRTILEKIEQAGIFLGDITYVSQTTEGKFVPNPNVMLELGYALAKIGDRRIITVLNEALGKPEELPFDLARHRWPIRYTLVPGETPTATARQKLAADFSQAIRDIVAAVPTVNADLHIRARIRSVLLDPENEVQQLHSLRAERLLLLDSAARGVFEILKDLPEPGVACIDANEQNAVRELIDAYRTFRLTTMALDNNTITFVGSQLRGNNFVGYWRILAGYCICIAAGWDEAHALRWVQMQNIDCDSAGCNGMYGIVKEDPAFQACVNKAKEACDRVKAATEHLQTFRS